MTDGPNAQATTRVTKHVSIAQPKEREITQVQSSWEGLYKVVTWMNDVIYRIQ
jgi:hypothetical protein